jgi:hypothetical protein
MPSVSAFCLSEPSERFINFVSFDTGVRAFECPPSPAAENDVRWADLDQSRKTRSAARLPRCLVLRFRLILDVLIL